MTSRDGLTAMPTRADLTQEETILGTVQYMAQQLGGKAADARQETLQFRLDDATENGLFREMALVGRGGRIVTGRRGKAFHCSANGAS